MIHLDESFLRGSYPPIITPFRNGAVDFDRFEALVDRQVREGSHGVLITGTTAEPSSLTIAERTDLVRAAVQTVAHRVPVVAATGSQSFAETTTLTTEAENAGADALLVKSLDLGTRLLEAITSNLAKAPRSSPQEASSSSFSQRRQ